jgi:hypothetical protein
MRNRAWQVKRAIPSQEARVLGPPLEKGASAVKTSPFCLATAARTKCKAYLGKENQKLGALSEIQAFFGCFGEAALS